MRGLDRWRRALRARYRLRREIGVWYRREYAVEALATTTRVPFVDVRRAERIVGALVSERLVPAAGFRRAEAATVQELLRVHAPSWLEAAGDAAVLGRVLGVDPSEVPVDDVLDAQRYAAGGTIAAARAVAGRARLKVAFNLGGGFHHAEPEQGSGFCVYNDVAVAIACLRADGFDGRVAVIDLDYHQGHGTRAAFANDPSVLTVSLHGSVWSHTEAVADVAEVMPSGIDDAAYLERLTSIVDPALETFQPALVFFVAGNDVLAGDKLGDFALTPAGVFERDRHVTELTSRLGGKLVVTLAGGYSDRAWRSSVSFLMWLLTGEAHAFEATDGDVASRYERIARTLDPAELQREDDDLVFTSEDIFGELYGPPRQRRLLGYYSAYGLEVALERYRFFDVLRGLGFDDFQLDVDPSEPERQVLRLDGRRPGMRERVRLIELVLRRRELPLPEAANDPTRLELLSVEWLLLQDPTRPFSLWRPPLPGQEHPGLGCARDVLELLAQIGRRLGLDGAVNRPAHYHVVFFAAGRMRFLDPEREGRFAAMCRVLADRDPAEASAAVGAKRLRLADGTVLAWEPAELVLPVSERLENWLSSARYTELRDRERDRLLDAGLSLTPAAEGG